MRYFTRGWAAGELDDNEADQVAEAYRVRLAVIAPRLPPAMLRMTREIRLHDALIERVIWDPASRRLWLSLVCEDREGGQLLMRLCYGGAMLGAGRVESLRRAAESRLTELLYDEVDVDDAGILSHRLLFAPSEEVTIDFENMDMTVSPRPDRRIELLRPFVVESSEQTD